ncbi:MAG: 50S ribosomal protein L35 [Candidatus Pacebacteria bacterium]|nr:50S ribosomal protein L35 [Candidatus Paceibacterota bacterium]
MKSKTRHSLTKRFKITKNGKILRRATGQDHFRAKKTGNQIRRKRKWVELNPSEAKVVKKSLKFLPIKQK